MARKPSPKPKRAVPIEQQAKRKRPSPASVSIAELDAKRDAFNSAFEPYILTLPETAKRPLGRPSTFKPEYCEAVVHYASLGHTIGATCGLLGISREVFNNWAVSIPDFQQATARAKTVRQAFYEAHLIDIARRGGDSTRLGAIKLGLLNVGGEDWKERLTAEHNVTFSWSQLLQESLKVADEPKAITIEGEVVKPTDDQKD